MAKQREQGENAFADGLRLEVGNILSLQEKAKRVPAIRKMLGDIYLHIYGGFPHYVNYPEMSFTFDKLQERDNKKCMWLKMVPGQMS